MSYQKVQRAYRRAREVIDGSHKETYKKLRAYAHQILQKNPGSRAKISTQEDPNGGHCTFKRFFLSFAGFQSGFFEGCRPFIGVDGCFLKGPYGGQLLTAIALDGNKGIFPLAFMVVESECNDAWNGFMYHLHAIIGDAYRNDIPWCFMSDRQKVNITLALI